MKITLEQFSGLVAGIYDAALDGSHWEPMLRQLVTAFDGNGGALLVAAPELRNVRHSNVGSDHAGVKAYNEYYGRMDPMAAALERAPAGALLSQSEIMSLGDLRRCEFYNDWEIPMADAGDAIAASLVHAGRNIAWFLVCAPPRSLPFGNAERMRLMRLLVPHLQQAIRVQSSFAELDLRWRSALDAFDRLAHGVVLFAGSGEVVFANRAAARMSASQDGLTIGRTCMRAARRDEDAALQPLVGRAAGKAKGSLRAGGTVAVTRPSGRRPFVVHVLPIEALAPDVPPAGVLAVIVDPEREPSDLPAMLRRLYRLTPAEATVASEVLRGQGLQSVADQMSVSLSTVRIHLQRVFDKTQTHRQAELARLLLTIEAGLVRCSSFSGDN